MQQTRPIVFFDIEATGADPLRDRIVEIAFVKRGVDGLITEMSSLVNPGMRIPTEAIAIHGIRNEDVSNAPLFKSLAPKIIEFLGDSDFGGFGLGRFDIPMLTEEFRRAGISFSTDGRHVIDALTIFH